MSAWEASGKSDDWFTPGYVLDALGETFDLDVAAPQEGPKHVAAASWISEDSLSQQWGGFVWMNPPYGRRNSLSAWLDKFMEHGNGLALTPDRTSAPWFQPALKRCDAVLFVKNKIKFERPDGTVGESPGTGSAIFAAGRRAECALLRAQCAGLGTCVKPMTYKEEVIQ